MTRTDKTMLALAAGGLGLWLMTRPRRSDLYSFAGKTVLITGGSRGLGLELARQLAQEGARIAIFARDENELERASQAISSCGHNAVTKAVDVTNAADVRAAVSHVEAQVGPIDVLINNASNIAVGPLSTMTRQDFEEALQVTFWGAYNTIEAVLPGMRDRHEGRIVNISSIGGKVAVPHLVPYSVGKFALVGYSQGLRGELSADGIVVTTVCPGLMRTGSPRNAFFKGRHSAEYAWFKVSDSLPLFTVSAEAAARATIEAARRGDAELVISMPAKLGVLMNALFPELTSQLLSLTNRLLPSDKNANSSAKLGKECDLPAALAAVTALTDKAARQNNEVDPDEQGENELGQ